MGWTRVILIKFKISLKSIYQLKRLKLFSIISLIGLYCFSAFWLFNKLHKINSKPEISTFILNPDLKNGNEHVYDWINVTDYPAKLGIYSAYVELQGNYKTLRVIGATRAHLLIPVYSHFYTKFKQLYKIVQCEFKTSKHPSHNMVYSPVFILCQFPNSFENPSYIRISSSFKTSSSPTHKLLPVIQINNSFKAPKQFAACVQPIYDYENPFQVLQWIEYQRMMGVEHFTFYNTSAGPKTSCLLNSYDKNIVDVLKWNIGFGYDEVQARGQIIQSNECVFRYRGKADYVLMMDFDEYLVPHPGIAKTYKQLLDFLFDYKNLFSWKDVNVAQLEFSNSLFGLGFESRFHSSIDKYDKSSGTERSNNEDKRQIGLDNLYIYKYTKRLEKTLSFCHRTKIITIPTKAIEPGIHCLWDSVKNSTQIRVPESIAYVHHYRECQWAANCSGKPTKFDNFARYSSPELLRRVQNKVDSIYDECNLTKKDFII